jgi:sugar lactone lactonase YvrE
LEAPSGVVVDSAGNVFINDARVNHRIRQVTPGGTISALASGLPDSLVDLKIDASGNLYAADNDYRIYKITRSGAVTVIAGAAQGYRGDNGPAIQAWLNLASAVAVDSNGNVYVADQGNNRVRMITPDGNIQTIAGNGTFESSCDGCAARFAHLMGPETLAVDDSGNLYIGEWAQIRKVTPAPAGTISTIAGPGSSVADDVLATSAYGGWSFAPQAPWPWTATGTCTWRISPTTWSAASMVTG